MKLNRRHFDDGFCYNFSGEQIRMIARFLALLLALTAFNPRADGQKNIPLYPDSIPNSITGTDEEYTSGKDPAVFNVRKPTLSIYLPINTKGKLTAVIICPGGGYGSLVIDREGHDVAKALMRKGIAAFVLKYRLPSDKTMKNRSTGPLQDAQQAIKIVRERASVYRLDTGKVGIMGFSAGGHLAASAGVRYQPALIENENKVNLRPDFMILVYPVITMDTIAGHKGSTVNLLGNSPSKDQIDYFSHHLHITDRTPPAFITVAGDDQMLTSSLLFFDACKNAKVPAELHVYAKGGHGFLKYPLFEEWSRLFLNWMAENKWHDTP